MAQEPTKDERAAAFEAFIDYVEAWSAEHGLNALAVSRRLHDRLEARAFDRVRKLEDFNAD